MTTRTGCSIKTGLGADIADPDPPVPAVIE